MATPAPIWLLSPPDVRAGSGRRVALLAQALGDLGVPVRLVRAEDGIADAAEATARIASLWRAERPRAVYIEVPGRFSDPWRRVALDLGLPLLATWHPISWMAREEDRQPLDRALRTFLGGCREVLAATATIRRELLADGLLDVSVVANGVDGRRFDSRHRDAELRRSWGAEAGTPVVLHVGRLETGKNLALLAEAFNAIAAAHPRARLVCIGAGRGEADLAAAVPGLIRPGFLEGPALAASYASADLFLFPSLADIYGNVTLEAAASGLAVVAFDRGAPAEHLRRAAELIATDDADAFVRAAVALAGDPDRRSALGRSARAAVEGLGWDTTARAFLQAVARAERVPPRFPIPGVAPVAAAIEAPLDDPVGALLRALSARGHSVRWHAGEARRLAIDGRARPLDELTAGLPEDDGRGAWSRRCEFAEGRLCAWAAGREPAARPLRIAAVLCAPAADGGVAKRFHRLLIGLRSRGHGVQVQAETALADPPGPSPDPAERARHAQALTRSLHDRWRADRPDAVHVELLDAFGCTAARAAIALGIPWTATWHPLPDHVPAAASAGVRSHLLGLASQAARVFAETTTQAAELAAGGLPRIGLVGNGVDAARFAPHRRNDGLRGSWSCSVAVLAVGRLLAAKNCAALVGIARALGRVPGARLVVAGDGPELAALRDAAPEALWLGAVPAAHLPAVYASADLFVFASRVDGFGLVVLEALASGLPVIGFDRAAVHDLVRHGVDGWRVPMDGDLATTVATAAADAAALAAMRGAARAAGEAAGWDAAAAAFAAELTACAGLSLPPAAPSSAR